MSALAACLFSEVAYDIKAGINNSRIVKYIVEVCCLFTAIIIKCYNSGSM